MQAHDDRVGRLSPAKRALLDQWRRQRAARSGSESPIPRRAAGAPAPLSFAQQRLWFLDQLEPRNPFYNVATAVRLVGRLDADALEESLEAAIARHESLRTTFRAVDGRPEQVVTPRIAWSLARIDLESTDAQQRETALRELAAREAMHPFDLARGPLLRGTLVRIAEQDHALLLTLHHIICDGWSMGVLRREIVEHYAALATGRPTSLDEPPIQYADFAQWQRARPSGAALDDALEYWRRQLADLPGPLELPLDFPRPAAQTFRGDVRRRRLEEPLVAALRKLAAEEDATLFMALLAAFQVLLARTSGQRDVSVGTPIANRNRRELEGVVGFFANTLVLRGDLSANPTLRDFLVQTRRTTLDAYAHQDLPFERLVERLQPPRDVSRTPLFQVMFVLQNIPIASRELAGLTAAEVSFDHAPVSNFDLTLNVAEQQGGLDLSQVFNPDLFRPVTIQRMLESYETLLRELVADRRQRVLEVSVLSAAQRQEQLVRWNDTAAAFPREKCIHELISQQAQRSPTAPAVLFQDQCLTYEQLDERASRLAKRLIALGVGPDSAVGLCVDRSPNLIVGMLGILKAGGAYLPLDPFYPRARLEYMIRDAGVALIVTSGELAGRLPEHDGQMVLLDDALAAEGDGDARAEAKVGADHLAYVIYTSGSTGQPKGVEVAHRGVVNHAVAIAGRLGLGRGDRLLQYLSLSFDAAAEEVFPALVSGAALYMHSTPSELSGRALLEWSRETAVNVLHIPPPVWLSVLDELSAHGSGAAGHLKAVMTGGDAVRADDVARWWQITGGRVKFLFAYGVTEATITSTLYEANGAIAAAASGRLPIGRPLANTRVYVLDEFSCPVAVGAPGELYIGGVGVARGYRRRPELMVERFIADPFAQEPNQRIYRTGDLVRYLHDGSIEFLNRLDHQVKVHGHRIEPGEIEAALRRHAAIREAAVVVRADATGENRLVAYVGCGSAERPTDADLRRFLSQQLPRHMVPSSIMALDRLPRLPSEKVDFQSLPSPTCSRSLPEQPYAGPEGPVESKLTEIWAGVLGTDRVGVHDNFFELGGDSIRGIQIIARASAAGLRMTPKQLFQHQTIAELARVVEISAASAKQQDPVVGPARLSPIQHAFFALELPQAHHFNQSLVLSVRSDVPPQILDAAARRLLAHHDALRMRFARSPDGGWVQTSAPPEDVPVLETVDMSPLSDADAAAAMKQAASGAQSSFKLESGRLVRMLYFDLGRHRPAWLLLVAHHLVVDAVSWPIVVEDLGSCCEQLLRGESARLPPKTASFAAWTERLASLADSPLLRRELDYWTSPNLSSARAPAIRRDHARGDNVVSSTEAVSVTLDRTATRRWLFDSQAAYRTRPHELLIAALAMTLCDRAASGEIRIELEGHGRDPLDDDLDTSRTVGWFTSLYPIALRRPESNRADNWVKLVKEQLRAVPNGGIGFGALRWLSSDQQVRNRLAAVPRPDVSFNYLGQFDEALPAGGPLALAGEAAGADRGPRNQRPHACEIIAHVRDHALHVEWQFSKNLHRRETIARLAEMHLAALRQLVEHCLAPEAGGATPSDFPLAGVDQEDVDRIAALLHETDCEAEDKK